MMVVRVILQYEGLCLFTVVQDPRLKDLLMVTDVQQRAQWLEEGWGYLKRDFTKVRDCLKFLNASATRQVEGAIGSQLSDDDDITVEVVDSSADEDELEMWKKFSVCTWKQDIEKAGVILEGNQRITLMMLWEHVDLMEWWSRHETVFPTIARLARVYLACPAAQSFQERVFSGAKIVMNAKRTNLKADLFERLTVLRHNKHWLLKKRDEDKERIRADELKRVKV